MVDVYATLTLPLYSIVHFVPFIGPAMDGLFVHDNMGYWDEIIEACETLGSAWNELLTAHESTHMSEVGRIPT